MNATQAFDSDATVVQRVYDARGFGRLTWLGFAAAGLGWMLLLGETGVADLVAVRTGRPVVATLHGDIVDIAKCLIGSGFGMAVIGGLQTGFGALNRFFAAVLTRSAQRAPAQPASQQEPIAAGEREAETPRSRRPYQILADGSVEVETIVGTRRFDSMDEARDFI